MFCGLSIMPLHVRLPRLVAACGHLVLHVRCMRVRPEHCQAVVDSVPYHSNLGANSGGSMSRSMVGLLATAAATMAALVGLVHGDVLPFMVAPASATSPRRHALLAFPQSATSISK
jgi:hypothetical protein